MTQGITPPPAPSSPATTPATFDMSPNAIPSCAREYRLPQRTAFSDLTLTEFDVPTPVSSSSRDDAQGQKLTRGTQGPDEVLVKLQAGSLQFRDLFVHSSLLRPSAHLRSAA